jgi:hypothetical protein
MGNEGIDLVAYGRLTESVDNLTTAVDKLSARLEELENDMVRGKGIFMGAIVAASLASVGLVKTIEKFL